MAVNDREGLTIRVRVQPKASRNAWQQEPDGALRVYLTAPPVEGAANKALVAFVAKELGIAKRAVDLLQGGKSRDKLLRLAGVTREDLERVLERNTR